MTNAMPSVRPRVPHFSSGPCAKRPGWTAQNLSDALLGRSHRSKPGKAKLKRAIDLTREVLRVPADYRTAVLLADVEDFSYKEIAGMLNVPIGTVMSRLSRGRKLLREQLSELARSYGIGRAGEEGRGA